MSLKSLVGAILEGFLGIVLLFAGTAVLAQDLPKTPLKVIGSIGGVRPYIDHEMPFWTKTLAEKSKGAIAADVKAFTEIGLKGPESLQLISKGQFDMGAILFPLIAGDDPAFEAVDIAGLVNDVEVMRKVAFASKPMYEKLLREKFGVKLLAVVAYHAQVLFCNGEINGLVSLKGKKVRVAGRSQSELMTALGISPVTLAFPEVLPALKAKSIDCAATGTLTGNIAKFHEATTHMMTLPITWGQIGYVANQKAFDKLDPRIQALIEAEFKVLEKNIWDGTAELTEQGYWCNNGAPACNLGTKGKMTLVKRTPEDVALLKKIVDEVMVPSWAARCSAACVAEFNAGIGRALGIKAVKK